MSFNREFKINEEQVADYLQSATEKVKTVENVDMLSDLNKLFKKNVPLTVRKYVIAFMLKESLKHYHSFGNSRRDRNDRSVHNDRNEKNNRRIPRERPLTPATESTAPLAPTEERPRHPRVEIPEGEGTSIFISIGKNRRVYPRDLVGLLIAVAGIDRECIGDIKVLANYSFVQLYTKDAQTAIDKLNGYDYRGRKLAVSYSRQKTDDENAETAEPSENAEAQPEIASPVSATEAMTEQEMAAEDAAAYAAAEKAAADKEPFGM